MGLYEAGKGKKSQYTHYKKTRLHHCQTGNANTTIRTTTCNHIAKTFWFYLPEVPDKVFSDDAHCF